MPFSHFTLPALTPLARALLHSQSGLHAGMWLAAIPAVAASAFTPDLMHVAMRRRLRHTSAALAHRGRGPEDASPKFGTAKSPLPVRSTAWTGMADPERPSPSHAALPPGPSVFQPAELPGLPTAAVATVTRAVCAPSTSMFYCKMPKASISWRPQPRPWLAVRAALALARLTALRKLACGQRRS